MLARPHHVVILGATGFTGGLVAAYFARNVDPRLTPWAIAGRSRDKLLAVRAKLAALNPACAALPMTLASSDDREALTALARSTRVVLSTVGPFAEHGALLFEICANEGTDYVDSAGEPAFVRAMHARFAEVATRSGALMVSCCGIDSIPTDLGLYFAMRALAQAHAPSGAVTATGMLAFDARPSGGTWRSVLSVMGAAGRDDLRAPAIEAGEGRGVRATRGRLRRDPEHGWLVPFPTVDRDIALRSAAALPAYGTDFSYEHCMVARSLPKLALFGVLLACAALVARLRLGRALLERVWPPGTGPSEARRARSWFRLTMRVRHAGGTVEAEVRGGDPGYDETAKMLAESALCLAVDRASLRARAGVLTPACAFGDVLLARLMRAGLVFEIRSRDASARATS
ncbi:MAG: saccharopine dehydrogenase NADP-binding domain-containing protein [Polyangiales bacterium]